MEITEQELIMRGSRGDMGKTTRLTHFLAASKCLLLILRESFALQFPHYIVENEASLVILVILCEQSSTSFDFFSFSVISSSET